MFKHSIRSEAIDGLKQFMDMVKSKDSTGCDQMVDIELKNGSIYCRARSGDETGFTHYHQARIDSYGIVHPHGRGYYSIKDTNIEE